MVVNQGRSMRETIRFELSIYALDHKRRFTDFLQEFVSVRKRCSKNTLIKYLRELVSDGVLEKIIDPTTFGPVYEVAEEKKQELRQMKIKRDALNSFDEYWESLSPEEKKNTGEHLRDLLEIKLLEDDIMADLLDPDASEKLVQIMKSLTPNDVADFYKSWLHHCREIIDER